MECNDIYDQNKRPKNARAKTFVAIIITCRNSKRKRNEEKRAKRMVAPTGIEPVSPP